MIHGKRSLILTDDALLEFFLLKLTPHQATVKAAIPTHIDSGCESYFEDVLEPAPIVPHNNVTTSLINIWASLGLEELVGLENEIQKLALELRAPVSQSQELSDFIYAMY
jgi:hypothetical protein